MHLSPRSRAVASCLTASLVVGMAACAPQRSDGTNDLDGVLWRQLSAVREPLSHTVYWSFAEDSRTYLDELPGHRWVGGSHALPPIEAGGIVIYDISATETTATFSVFVASGPRPRNATNAGTYWGPSEIFTCYRIHAVLTERFSPAVERTIFDGCPEELVGQLAEDATFARIDEFDG